MTFVLFFPLPSYMWNPFLFISLFVQNTSLCAQHSSRPFAERSPRKLLSPPLFCSFFLFFGTIFEMHSQLSSADLFAPAFAELQDHPGETRARSLPSVVKASSSKYYSSLSLFLPLSVSFFFWFFVFIFVIFCDIFFSFSPKRAAGREGTSHRDRD